MRQTIDGHVTRWHRVNDLVETTKVGDEWRSYVYGEWSTLVEVRVGGKKIMVPWPEPIPKNWDSAKVYLTVEVGE